MNTTTIWSVRDDGKLMVMNCVIPPHIQEALAFHDKETWVYALSTIEEHFKMVEDAYDG